MPGDADDVAARGTLSRRVATVLSIDIGTVDITVVLVSRVLGVLLRIFVHDRHMDCFHYVTDRL